MPGGWMAGARLALEAAAGSRWPGAIAVTGRASLAVRPESIRLMPPGAPARWSPGTVELCTYLGAVVEHVVRLDAGAAIVVRGHGIGADAARTHAAGDAAWLCYGRGRRVAVRRRRPAGRGGTRSRPMQNKESIMVEAKKSGVDAAVSRRMLLGGAALLAAPALITRRAQAAETLRGGHLGWRLCAAAAREHRRADC